MARDLESPEEHGEGRRARRGGASERREGGFREGEFGRGPSPYSKSMSGKPGGHSIAAHAADAGRGTSGVIGKGDDFKGRSEDIEHPQSHDAFERLGTERE